MRGGYRQIVTLLALLAASAAQGEACFDVGPEKGQLGFEIDQAGTAFSGKFAAFGGRVCMGGGKVAHVEAWVEPKSVDAGLPEIDDALRGDDFFAVEQYPRATFQSDSVEQTADGYVAHGTLQVKGTSKSVDVPFTISNDGNARRVDGAFELHRLDFGVGTGEWADTRWVGPTATIKFSGRLE